METSPKDIPADVKSTLKAMQKPSSITKGSLMRLAFFAATVLVTLTVSVPLMGGYLIGAAMSAGGTKNQFALWLIPSIALSVIITAAIFTFKNGKPHRHLAELPKTQSASSKSAPISHITIERL